MFFYCQSYIHILRFDIIDNCFSADSRNESDRSEIILQFAVNILFGRHFQDSASLIRVIPLKSGTRWIHNLKMLFAERILISCSSFLKLVDLLEGFTSK